ncbi:MAG TPA: cytochrome-c oxidase, cbb3-type subunit III, partial [Defluviicoccus sp.]|nr:cytochrome-c oxidase, cbb3-type subunit III [Defluviicoccus sp.]
WDGIKELNTPLPKWWLYVFYATIIWSAVYMVVFPAVPWLSGYTRGIWGYSSRADLNQAMANLRAERAVWYDQFAQKSLQEIVQDDRLLQFARAGGEVIFAENCAACHGTGGVGRPGYPVLVDDEWIWGGKLDDVHTTITYGIRNANTDSRQSAMPAFGADGVLTPQEIAAVADHVLSLSGAGPANAEGARIYAENCNVCHGDVGEGIADVGAPALNNQIWLFGGGRDALIAQITRPRQGVMPAWTGRLDDVQIKQVAVYVHTVLGGGQ